MFSWKVITDLEDFQGLQERWRLLCEADSRTTLFNTFEWAESWINCYWLPEYVLHIVVIEKGADVIAILPLYLNKKKHTLLFLGTGEPEFSEISTEYLDVIINNNLIDLEDIYIYIANYLKNVPASSIQFVNCLEGSHIYLVSKLLSRVALTATGNSYQLLLDKEIESPEIGTSSKQRKKCRQLLRRFENDKNLSFQAMSEVNYELNWEVLKSLHERDWQSRGAQGAFIADSFNKFHHHMYIQYPHLMQYFSLLKYKDEVISVHHYYKYKNTLYFYLTGTIKNKYNRLSPGMMLHTLCISAIQGSGLNYDFMKGKPESYKRYLGIKGENFCTITIFGEGFLGNLRFMKYKLLILRKIIKDGISRLFD